MGSPRVVVGQLAVGPRPRVRPLSYFRRGGNTKHPQCPERTPLHATVPQRRLGRAARQITKIWHLYKPVCALGAARAFATCCGLWLKCMTNRARRYPRPEFVQQHQAEAERAGRAQPGREADDVVAGSSRVGVLTQRRLRPVADCTLTQSRHRRAHEAAPQPSGTGVEN